MKVIIAGIRYIDPVKKIEFTDYEVIKQAVSNSGFIPTEIVSGMAKGVDTLAIRFARENNLKLTEFPADWYPFGKYDNSAGHKRNLEMANYADALVAIWDGESHGTQSMIRYARQKGLKVYVYMLTSP
jgi:glycerophosphoryl diester phosphodiesterase